jgi:4-amino-4-deoxy-L-arabinose transferase-like glycosyltransferase
VALSAASGRRSPAAFLVALGLVAALAALLRAPVAGLPFERDEGEYAYIGWRWLEGDVPYLHGFDQKPPAVLVVYAALEATFGGSPRAIHWGAQLYTLASLALLLRLGERAARLRVGAAAAALLAFATTAPGTLGSAANVELFALLPLVASALAAWSGAESGRTAAALGAGAAAGAALAFKPVVLPMAGFAALLLLFRRPHPLATRVRLAGAFAAGVVGFWLPLLAYFAAKGALGALYDATIRFNLAYGTALSLSDYPEALRQVLPGVSTALGPLALGALAGPLARALGGVAGEPPSRRDRLWLFGWLGSGLLAVAAGGYFRHHYFQLAAPPLALLAALGLDDALQAFGTPTRRRAAALAGASAALLLAGAAATPWYFLPGEPARKLRRIYGANPFVEAPILAELIASRSEPDDTVFVYGSEPELLFYARRRSASRYILAYHYLMGPADDMRARQQEVLAELRAAPPRLLVAVLLRTSLLEHEGSPPDLRHGLAEAVRRGYRPVAVVPPPREGEPAEVRTDAATLRVWGSGAILERPAPEGVIVVWERYAAGPDGMAPWP